MHIFLVFWFVFISTLLVLIALGILVTIIQLAKISFPLPFSGTTDKVTPDTLNPHKVPLDQYIPPKGKTPKIVIEEDKFDKE